MRVVIKLVVLIMVEEKISLTSYSKMGNPAFTPGSFKMGHFMVASSFHSYCYTRPVAAHFFFFLSGSPKLHR